MIDNKYLNFNRNYFRKYAVITDEMQRISIDILGENVTTPFIYVLYDIDYAIKNSTGVLCTKFDSDMLYYLDIINKCGYIDINRINDNYVEIAITPRFYYYIQDILAMSIVLFKEENGEINK